MDESYAASEGLPLDAELSFSIGNSSTLKQRVTKVFELLRDPVYRYLFRILGDRANAEDLTQEVFLRLYSHLHGGGGVANVRAWVFRVAHNLAIDYQRKKVHLEPYDAPTWYQAPDPAPCAEDRVLEDERQRRLQRALSELSSEERHCLELRAEGLTYQEIADVLDIRLPTLVKYLGRIIRKLVKQTAYV